MTTDSVVENENDVSSVASTLLTGKYQRKTMDAWSETSQCDATPGFAHGHSPGNAGCTTSDPLREGIGGADGRAEGEELSVGRVCSSFHACVCVCVWEK